MQSPAADGGGRFAEHQFASLTFRTSPRRGFVAAVAGPLRNPVRIIGTDVLWTELDECGSKGIAAEGFRSPRLEGFHPSQPLFTGVVELRAQDFKNLLNQLFLRIRKVGIRLLESSDMGFSQPAPGVGRQSCENSPPNRRRALRRCRADDGRSPLPRRRPFHSHQKGGGVPADNIIGASRMAKIKVILIGISLASLAR